MNTICGIKAVLGVWLVKVRAPGGKSILVNCKGTREAALAKALRAEPA